MKDDVSALRSRKRAMIEASNIEEFIEDKIETPESAARCNTRQLDRTIHIRTTAVDNQDGPLSRSIIASTSGKLVSPHGSSTTATLNDQFHFDGLEERVRNIETHLGIVIAPIEKSLIERIKVLEDKILKIEELYPQIAAHVFNYGRAEVEASSKPGGRVSGRTGAKGAAAASQKFASQTADNIAADFEEDSSLNELKRRMDDVRHRLLNKASSKS